MNNLTIHTSGAELIDLIHYGIISFVCFQLVQGAMTLLNKGTQFGELIRNSQITNRQTMIYIHLGQSK